MEKILHCNEAEVGCNTAMRVRASEFLELRRVVDFEGGGGGGERLQRLDEIARGGDREVSQQCIAIGPPFDENQPQGILAIDMNRVGEATRFAARAMHVFEAEPQDFIPRVLPREHAAGDDNHAVLPHPDAHAWDGIYPKPDAAGCSLRHDGRISIAQFGRPMTMRITASFGQISLRDKSYQQRYACHGERILFIVHRDRCDCAGMKQSNRFRAELWMLVAG